jgi:protein SCO1/2
MRVTRRLARRRIVALGVSAVLAIGVATAAAPSARVEEADALRISQAAIGRQLDGLTFITSQGDSLAIESLRGRPLVLSLVYTSCYYVCSGLTLHLRESVKIARDALGPRSFSVLTVGFDTRNDTPERMRQYARERGVDVAGWTFASVDATTVDRLAQAVGFTYFPSPKGFDHVTQTTIVDARGRVVAQVYGEDFAPPLLVEPLKRLALGEVVAQGGVESLVGQLKLFCTIYDPSSGRYRFDYSLIVEIVAGALALGIAAVGIAAASRNVR